MVTVPGTTRRSDDVLQDETSLRRFQLREIDSHDSGENPIQ